MTKGKKKMLKIKESPSGTQFFYFHEEVEPVTLPTELSVACAVDCEGESCDHPRPLVLPPGRCPGKKTAANQLVSRLIFAPFRWDEGVDGTNAAWKEFWIVKSSFQTQTTMKSQGLADLPSWEDLPQTGRNRALEVLAQKAGEVHPLHAAVTAYNPNSSGYGLLNVAPFLHRRALLATFRAITALKKEKNLPEMAKDREGRAGGIEWKTKEDFLASLIPHVLTWEERVIFATLLAQRAPELSETLREVWTEASMSQHQPGGRRIPPRFQSDVALAFLRERR